MLCSGAGRVAGGRNREKWRGRGRGKGGREGEAAMREGCSEAVCREEARINSHCRYRRLGQVMEHDGEFSSSGTHCARWRISFLVLVRVVPASRLPDRLHRTESFFRAQEIFQP